MPWTYTYITTTPFGLPPVYRTLFCSIAVLILTHTTATQHRGSCCSLTAFGCLLLYLPATTLYRLTTTGSLPRVCRKFICCPLPCLPVLIICAAFPGFWFRTAAMHAVLHDNLYLYLLPAAVTDLPATPPAPLLPYTVHYHLPCQHALPCSFPGFHAYPYALIYLHHTFYVFYRGHYGDACSQAFAFWFYAGFCARYVWERSFSLLWLWFVVIASTARPAVPFACTVSLTTRSHTRQPYRRFFSAVEQFFMVPAPAL